MRERSCNHPKTLPFIPQFLYLPPLSLFPSAYLHNMIKTAVIITAASEECTEYFRFLVGSGNPALCIIKMCGRAPGVLASSQVYLTCPKVSSLWYCGSHVGRYFVCFSVLSSCYRFTLPLKRHIISQNEEFQYHIIPLLIGISYFNNHHCSKPLRSFPAFTKWEVPGQGSLIKAPE